MGVAYAAIPDSAGTVHACYQNVTSANKPLKLLDTAKNSVCPSGWKPVTWNQKGQPGTPGTPGAPGTPGVSGYEVVTGTFDVTTQGPIGAGTDVMCPTGKVPLGGGYRSGGAFASLYTTDDSPLFTKDANGNVIGGGWRVHVQSSSGFGTDATFTVSVTCATTS